MADGLYLPVFAKIEHAVDTGAERHAPGIGVRGTEGVERLPGVRDHALRLHEVSVPVGDHDGIAFGVVFGFQVLPARVEEPGISGG